MARIWEKYESCPKCWGKGWHPEEVPGQDPDEPYPDWREKYCDCPAGELRKKADGY